MLKALNCRGTVLLAFPASYLLIYFILLLVYFGTGKVSPSLVAAALSIICLILFFNYSQARLTQPFKIEGSLILLVGLASVFILIKCLIHPFSGADTAFRWHLLPQLMFLTGTLDYYPPATMADYQLYFLVIVPLLWPQAESGGYIRV
ncbi:MAG: hypothetical protein HC904_12835 [Blastochloris sp.]|nr:hypothetical protein [Blastochloris sp.]